MNTQQLVNDYLSFNGRLGKEQFVKRYLFVFLLSLALLYAGRFLGMDILSGLSGVLVIPQMSLIVRRCHDIGLSWLKTIGILLSLLIPIASLIALIYLCRAKGQRYINQFG